MDSTAATILAVSLMIIMLGMGLSLTVEDFKRVLKFPKAIALGLINQIILLPLIGFALAGFFKVEPHIAVGIIILAACPGGPTSNLLTHLAKGDVALSVSLTAVNSLITIISIPLFVNLGLNAFMAEDTSIAAPTGSIVQTLLMVIAIPLGIGMTINKLKPTIASKIDKPVRVFSATILFVIIIALVLRLGEQLVGFLTSALLIALALNVTTMLVGFFSSRLAKLSFRESLTISIESGNQNGTLAITVAVAVLQNEAFAIAAAVYSLIMYGTALIPIGIGNKQATKAAS